MSVDMYERRFRQELAKLPLFIPDDVRDERAWKMDFPAWRALFSSLALYGHSTGYRLPSLEDFFAYCKRAYAERHADAAKRRNYAEFFQEPLLNGMRQRVSAWYESGMAETYLYVCLIEAIEDKMKCGVVLYDPRADWKLKADVIVVINRQPLRISAFFGEKEGRSTVEARRDRVERLRKRNTLESAHWGNKELDAMPALEIARTETESQTVNGVRLFSLKSINDLLASIYQRTGAEGGYYFPAR